MGRTKRTNLTIEEQIYELQVARRLFMQLRRSGYGVRARLVKENKQLRADKAALLKYIKELEGFLNINEEI